MAAYEVRAMTRSDRPAPSGMLRAILWGGLLGGAADAIYAMVYFGWLGANPVRIWQSVAGGLLTRERSIAVRGRPGHEHLRSAPHDRGRASESRRALPGEAEGDIGGAILRLRRRGRRGRRRWSRSRRVLRPGGGGEKQRPQYRRSE